MKKFILIPCFLLAGILQAQQLLDIVPVSPPSMRQAFLKSKSLFDKLPSDQWNDVLPKLIAVPYTKLLDGVTEVWGWVNENEISVSELEK